MLPNAQDFQRSSARPRAPWPRRQHADAILPTDDKAGVITVLGPLPPKDIILGSDGSGALAAAAKALGAAHRPINLSAGMRVVDGVYHVQNATVTIPRQNRDLYPRPFMMRTSVKINSL